MPQKSTKHPRSGWDPRVFLCSGFVKKHFSDYGSDSQSTTLLPPPCAISALWWPNGAAAHEGAFRNVGSFFQPDLSQQAMHNITKKECLKKCLVTSIVDKCSECRSLQHHLQIQSCKIINQNMLRLWSCNLQVLHSKDHLTFSQMWHYFDPLELLNTFRF